MQPRETLNGECKALKDNLKISANRNLEGNHLLLEITYDCIVTSRNHNLQSVTVLNFTAETRHEVLLKATTTHLEFSLSRSEVKNANFKPASDKYYVQNMNLAMFKAGHVLAKLAGQKVFGTGFPTIPHHFPTTAIDAENAYVVYYDSSHRGEKTQMSDL